MSPSSCNGKSLPCPLLSPCSYLKKLPCSHQLSHTFNFDTSVFFHRIQVVAIFYICGLLQMALTGRWSSVGQGQGSFPINFMSHGSQFAHAHVCRCSFPSYYDGESHQSVSCMCSKLSEETPALQCIASKFMECVLLVLLMIPMKEMQLSCIKIYRGICAYRNFVVYKNGDT